MLFIYFDREIYARNKVPIIIKNRYYKDALSVGIRYSQQTV